MTRRRPSLLTLVSQGFASIAEGATSIAGSLFIPKARSRAQIEAEIERRLRGVSPWNAVDPWYGPRSDDRLWPQPRSRGRRRRS